MTICLTRCSQRTNAGPHIIQEGTHRAFISVKEAGSHQLLHCSRTPKLLDSCYDAGRGEPLNPEAGALIDVQPWGDLVVYASQRGGLHARDVRAKHNVWQLPCKPAGVSLTMCC